MPLPQNIPITITPENVWAVLDSVESDFEDELADVMEDSDTEFVIEDEEIDDNPDKENEKNTDISNSPDTNETLHAIVHERNTTKNDVEANNTMKEIHWTKSTEYISVQKKCELDGEVLLDINPLDNPLKVFDKLLKFDEFLQHLKLESERYAAQNGRTFKVSIDEIRAFIGINFVMGYHKLPTLRSYWETSASMTVSFIANVMTRERFKEILSNLHFSNNDDSLPKDHPDYDRSFKVRWLIDYLNERFLGAMESEADQSVDEHMVKFKGRSIMRQHIKNKPIKCC